MAPSTSIRVAPLTPRSVWIRLPNWVGDCIMATPVLAAIRAEWPQAHITWCGRALARRLLHEQPWYDAFVPHERGGGLLGFVRAVRLSRRHRPEVAIVLPSSFRAAWLARMVGARVRLGHRTDGRGWLLTHALDRPREPDGRTRPVYMADLWAELLATIGLEVRERTPRLEISAATRARADALLDAHPAGKQGALIVINPGASYGPSKMWPAERFAALATRLYLERGARITITTGPGEEAVADTIARALAIPHQLFRGRELPLDTLIGLIDRAALLVTNDTGPRHIAVARGVPSVVLMGPTDPRYSASPAERGELLRRTDLACMPCSRTRCPLRGEAHHQCLRGIDERQVYEAVLRVLARAPHDGGCACTSR